MNKLSYFKKLKAKDHSNPEEGQKNVKILVASFEDADFSVAGDIERFMDYEFVEEIKKKLKEKEQEED